MLSKSVMNCILGRLGRAALWVLLGIDFALWLLLGIDFALWLLLGIDFALLVGIYVKGLEPSLMTRGLPLPSS